jgi:hypothetical protein
LGQPSLQNNQTKKPQVIYSWLKNTFIWTPVIIGVNQQTMRNVISPHHMVCLWSFSKVRYASTASIERTARLQPTTTATSLCNLVIKHLPPFKIFCAVY